MDVKAYLKKELDCYPEILQRACIGLIFAGIMAGFGILMIGLSLVIHKLPLKPNFIFAFIMIAFVIGIIVGGDILKELD
jgi:hypothetical protein